MFTPLLSLIKTECVSGGVSLGLLAGISTLVLMTIPRAGKTKVAERKDIEILSITEFEIWLLLLPP